MRQIDKTEKFLKDFLARHIALARTPEELVYLTQKALEELGVEIDPKVLWEHARKVYKKQPPLMSV